MNLNIDVLYEAYVSPEFSDCAYLSAQEEREDLFRVLDCLLFVFESVREEGAVLAKGLGLSFLPEGGADIEAFAPLTEKQMAVCEQCAEQLLTLTDALHSFIEERRLATGKDADVLLPFYTATERAACSDYEKLALLCMFAAMHARKYADYFAKDAGEKRAYGVVKKSTVAALYRLGGGEEPPRAETETGLFSCFLARTERDDVFCLNRAAYALLLGADYETAYCFFEAGAKDDICSDFGAECARLAGLRYARFSQQAAAFVVAGEAGSGRKTLARRVLFAECGKVLHLRLGTWMQAQASSAFFPKEQESIELFLNEAILLAKVYDAGVLVSDVPAKKGNEPLFERLVQLVKRLARPVFFITEEASVSFQPLLEVKLRLPETSQKENSALWTFFLARLQLGDEALCARLASDYANRYVMTAADIRRTVENVPVYLAGAKDLEAALAESCYQARSHSLGSLAELIPAKVHLADLVVSKETEKQLAHFMARVRCKALVGEGWGFFEKTAYGRGASALFYGPPGTGKTMAAQAIGNELGLDVFRVDISQMVSKYIGETEKNISELFLRAARLNAILFFDEADALFARRSKVQDANDRNANAETAHLLQKLEGYQGAVILATNLKENIDDAFKRRIKYIVNFQLPALSERKRLWQQVFPEQAPKEALSLSLFAEHFELSGSAIKEVAESAAFAAAAEGAWISDVHIMEALRMYYEKAGRKLTDDDFRFLYG